MVISVLVLILSIYVLVTGKLRFTPTFGVKGGIARIIGAVYLLIAIGFFIALITTKDLEITVIAAVIQFAFVIIAPIVAVIIHGNDFAKPEVPRQSITSEELLKYKNSKKLLTASLVTLGIAYLIVAVELIFFSAPNNLYGKIAIGFVVASVTLSHIFAFFGCYRASKLLNESYAKYVAAILLVSTVLLLNGPLVTIYLLKPIVKHIRQSSQE